MAKLPFNLHIFILKIVHVDNIEVNCLNSSL